MPAARFDETAGFVELTGWTLIELGGDDRATFLHNFCTNEIRKLALGVGCEAFLLDAKGHVLFYVLVFCLEGRLLLHAPPGCGEALVKHLDRYLIREKVSLLDRSAEFVQFLLAGPGIAGEASRVFGIAAPEAALNVVACPRFGEQAFVARVIHAPATNYLLVVARDAVEELRGALAASGCFEYRIEAWHAPRIEAGFPLSGVDVGSRNLAQEVDRIHETISFTKGCYLGQETVARLDALGHVNKTLVGLKFKSAGRDIPIPDAGFELSHGGQAVGQVTSAAYSSRLGCVVALGYVRRGCNTPGTLLDSRIGSVEITPLPMP